MRPYSLILVSIVLAGCARPANESDKPDPPQPAVGIFNYSAANPLPVQTESDYVTDQQRWGRLLFDRTDMEVVDGSEDDGNDVAGTIQRYHQLWLDQNNDAIRQLLDDDIIRVRSGRVARGAVDVSEQITGESRGERPDGYSSSMQLAIYGLRISVHGDLATAMYRTAVNAGARWEYADIATIMQVFRRSAGGWRLLGHTESVRLGDYSAPPISESVPTRRAPFRFDFVYPAQNLDRAIDFYTPLLGKPVAVTESTASFRFSDSYFELAVEPLNRRVQMKEGYANGYAVVEVPHFGLIRRGMSDREWSAAVFTVCGVDRCLITEDPSGNVIVWRRDRPQEIEEQVWPTVSVSAGENNDSVVSDRVVTNMSAWMASDSDAVTNQLAPNAVWIDDSERVASGKRNIVRALGARWRPFFHGIDGIDGDLSISNMIVHRAGDRWLVTFDAAVAMRTDPKDSFSMHVMQVWRTIDGQPKIEQSFMARANTRRDMPVNNMDYTAYPVADLGVSGRYYKILLNSEPYRDNDWFGFWSTSSVFGLVGENSDYDSFRSIPHRANGYADFSVRSVEEVYDYLREKGATFPLIPGINDKRGIDPQPGYKQILAVDSEGNLVNFSQYMEY